MKKETEAMRDLMTRVYFDTEDNALALQKTGRPSWGKRCTEIAAICDDGSTFRVKFAGAPNPELFFDYCRRKGPVEAWSHGLDYDLSNLFPGQLDVPDICLAGGKITSARIPGIKFRDCSNLYPMPLADLGSDFGIPKLPLEHPDRCIQDVKIVQAAVCLAASQVEPWGVDLPGTVGGLSLALWRSLGGANWRCLSPVAREAFYGGRVEIFRPYSEGRILQYDSASCYPACMLGKFADRCDPWFGLKGKSAALARLVGNAELYGVARCRVEWDGRILAPLPVRYLTRDGPRTAFPSGQFEGVWDVAEIRSAIRHGARIIELQEAWGGITGSTYYSDLVKFAYNARKTAETSGLALLFKLLMNNLFGQLGATGEVTRGLLLERNSRHVAGRDIPTREGVPYGSRILCDVQATPPPCTNWLHAAAIAAAGRVRMLTALASIPPERLIYCDTDCVFFDWPANVAPPFPETGRIGDFRFQGEHRRVVCLAPKIYQSVSVNGNSKTVAKGVPKTSAEEYFEKGVAGFWQPWRIRESILAFDASLKNPSEPIQHGVWRQCVRNAKFAKYGQKKICGGFYFPHTSDVLEKILGPAEFRRKH